MPMLDRSFATDLKAGGVPHTPQPVAKLMTQIAFLGREDEQGIYHLRCHHGIRIASNAKVLHQPR